MTGPLTLAKLVSLALLLWALRMGVAQAASTGVETQDELIPGAAIAERVLAIPGDLQNPVPLEVTLLAPPGSGPFPLAVLNHGATNASAVSRGQRSRRTFLAFYFLSRGYAVALPMMRGFAESGGKIVGHGCDFVGIGRENAKDIRVVIDFLSHQAIVDPSKTVVAGQSFGGWNTLAVGANRQPSIKGLINFNGGLRTSDCPNAERALIAGAGEFGAHSFVPTLWFYGDNDTLFSTALWRAMHQSYTAVGGSAELVAFGRFNTDSHQLLSYPEGLAIWTPRVDAFLARVGLPNRLVHPDYLPKPWPPPTHFARLDDVDAVPYLTDKGKAIYREFLAKPIPRVFLISAAGSAIGQFGGFDPLAQGLAMCRRTRQSCRAYAIDDAVVFTPPPSRPPPSLYATIENTDALPYLRAEGRELYKRFLALPAPRAFVISPNGAAFAASGRADPFAQAWFACEDAGQKCEPYAIDNDVVWRASGAGAPQ